MEEKIIVDELASVDGEPKETDNMLAALSPAINGLVSGLRKFMPLEYRRVSKHQLSKRGATHKLNATFKGRDVLPMTPAQYRHYHFGAKQKEA